MKIITYLIVFCMLLFLLLLSFEERGYDTSSSEWNEISATLEAEMHDNWIRSIPSAGEMRENEEVEIAQEEGNTVFDIMKTSFDQLIEMCCESIDELTHSIARQTKEGAYQFVTDVAELVYPSKHKKSTHH